jgi:hypothetical protein
VFFASNAPISSISLDQLKLAYYRWPENASTPRYPLHFARSPMFLEELTGTMNSNVGVPTLALGLSEMRHPQAGLGFRYTGKGLPNAFKVRTFWSAVNRLER